MLFVFLSAAMLGGCGAEDARWSAEDASELSPSELSANERPAIPGAAEKSAPAPAAEVQWREYVDPSYDIAVHHPAGWEVRPRIDAPDQVGATLSFVEPASEQAGKRP
jgi:hypothetical protein